MTVRMLAAQALSKIVFLGKSLPYVFGEFAKKLQDPRDRALLHALLFESTRWYLRLDALLKKLLDQPLQQREPDLHCLLIIGLAQLIYLDMPAYAAVAASVNAARELKRAKLTGLVNAVLRRYLRERSSLEQMLEKDPVVRYSHPRWLYEQLSVDWPEQTEEILITNNIAAPLWLRINRRRISKETYYETLARLGLAPQSSDICSDALLLSNNVDVQQLPGYQQGYFSVQDGSAQLAVDLLDLKNGQCVLDACAAPGGKTTHILERADVRLVALDCDRKRVQRMEENLQRLGLHAELRTGDAAETTTWWDGQLFDRILLDAPCSATGIIRRQPDIKLHRRREDINALVGQQMRLLQTLWPLLNPGGRLVYATCSILKSENEHQIVAFLEQTSTAYIHPEWPINWGISATEGRQNLPGRQNMDGFFYAILQKCN